MSVLYTIPYAFFYFVILCDEVVPMVLVQLACLTSSVISREGFFKRSSAAALIVDRSSGITSSISFLSSELCSLYRFVSIFIISLDKIIFLVISLQFLKNNIGSN